MSKTIAIHQPNFCPRMSYFQKIAEADVFVLLGHCQYSSSGFQNRFNVGDKMYNMVVDEGKDLIVRKKYKNPQRDWNKITRAFPLLEPFNGEISESLYTTNYRIIIRACSWLDIPPKVRNDYPTDLTGTARLVDICKKHEATKYLSGISGLKYLDIKLFEKAGIEVIFQDEAKMDKRPLHEVI